MSELLYSNQLISKPIPLDLGSVVHLGIPYRKSPDKLELIAPDEPHLFKVSTLRFNDDINPTYQNVVILMAHGGFVKLKSGYHWLFSNGSRVSNVTYSLKQELDIEVDFIVACSGSFSSLDNDFTICSLPDGINEGEFKGIPNNAACIIGEDIKASAFILPDSNNVNFRVYCDVSKLRNKQILERRRSSMDYREL